MRASRMRVKLAERLRIVSVIPMEETMKGLTTHLVGKRVCPKPEWGSCTDSHDANGRMWASLKPSADGTYTAEIDAAWTEQGSTKLAVHDPHGNTAEFYLTNVNLYLV